MALSKFQTDLVGTTGALGKNLFLGKFWPDIFFVK
jgi:hypothetical protein